MTSLEVPEPSAPSTRRETIGVVGLTLAVIRRALQMSPPHAWAQRFKNLRSTLQVRRLETTLLRVDVRGEKDYVPFETDVLWRVRIRNVSPREIVIGPPDRPTELWPAGFVVDDGELEEPLV